MKQSEKANQLIDTFCEYHKISSKLKTRLVKIYSSIKEELTLGDSLEDLSIKNEILNYLLSELSSPFGKKKEDEEVKEDVIYKYNYIYLHSSSDVIEEYSPLSSNIKAACSFFKQLNKPYTKTNPTVSLLEDIFSTIFNKLDGFSTMISSKLYTEAYATWRTIHESECIVYLLVTGGSKTQSAYLRHIAYNNAYRNPESFTVEENDYTFLMIKEEMRQHDLKSKDMKKFIEYGWMFSYPDLNVENFKLNFRDGVEKLAKLTKYNYIYEGASEVVHSSSSFFYANDKFCKDLSLDMTYQSAIRIFTLYHDHYSKLFKKADNEKKYQYFMKTLEDTLVYIRENFDDEKLYENDYHKKYREMRENMDK